MIATTEKNLLVVEGFWSGLLRDCIYWIIKAKVPIEINMKTISIRATHWFYMIYFAIYSLFKHYLTD